MPARCPIVRARTLGYFYVRPSAYFARRILRVSTFVPQPPGHWLLGHLLEQRRDPLGLLVRGLREHGDVVAYRFGPYRALQLNHPRLIKRVLVDNAANYKKWSALERARPLLGESSRKMPPTLGIHPCTVNEECCATVHRAVGSHDNMQRPSRKQDSTRG